MSTIRAIAESSEQVGKKMAEYFNVINEGPKRNSNGFL